MASWRLLEQKQHNFDHLGAIPSLLINMFVPQVQKHDTLKVTWKYMADLCIFIVVFVPKLFHDAASRRFSLSENL